MFVNSQSNAHAHEQLLKEVDRITIPMKNVFSLDRDLNQSFDIQDIVWSGYTTQGKNLGETQDHTCSFVYCLAKLWQQAIDDRMKLPDMYIVQISVGSQGIINGMCNPDKEGILKPGSLGTVDISLFPFALKREVGHGKFKTKRNKAGDDRQTLDRFGAGYPCGYVCPC